MRLLGLFVVAAVLCVAHDEFKSASIPSDLIDGSLRIANPLVLLLREQYTKTLLILGTYRSTSKNTSRYSLTRSHELISGAIDDAEIADEERKDTSDAPDELIIHPPNTPSIPATQTKPETYHTSRLTTISIAQISEETAEAKGTSWAGNSASTKLNALGAMLVFVGAAFALL